MTAYIVNTAQGQELEIEAESMEIDPERSRTSFKDVDGNIIASFVGANGSYPKPDPQEPAAGTGEDG